MFIVDGAIEVTLLAHHTFETYFFHTFTGCPFKHSDVDLLRQKLESCDLSKSDAAEVRIKEYS